MHSINKVELKDLDNVSLTAYRIISIFNMLIEKPCNDVEINEKLHSDIVGARMLSKDTICIYINTLRAIGFQISRPSKNNDYKYVLKSHPFKLNLSCDEIKFLAEINKNISSFTNDWKLLLNIEKLTNVLLENLNTEQKKKFLQIQKASLKGSQLSQQFHLINNLEQLCNKKRTVIISYDSPEYGEKYIEMTVDKLSYENNSLYLWGHNLKLDETQYLRVDRIIDIKAVNLRSTRCIPSINIVRFKLKGIAAMIFIPNEDENIIKKNEKELLVEVKSKNKFKLTQRILSFGSDCLVIYPDSYRNEILSKFKSMMNLYNMSRI